MVLEVVIAFGFRLAEGKTSAQKVLNSTLQFTIIAMRLLFTFLLSSLLSGGLASAQDSVNLDEKDPYDWSAKVGAYKGMGWYVMAEPLRAYKVLDRSDIDVTNGQVDEVHLKQLYNIFKYRGLKLKKAYPEADALLSPDGSTVKVIRYTDDVERHRRIGNVQTVAGKEVYLWSEPLKVNDDAFRIYGEGQLEAQRNYLEKGMENLVKKANKVSQEKDQPYDALVIKKDYIQAIKYYTPDS